MARWSWATLTVNAFREKQSKNWKKLLSFSFGKDNKENKDAKPAEDPAPVTDKKINTKEILKLTEEAHFERLCHGSVLPPHSR